MHNSRNVTAPDFRIIPATLLQTVLIRIGLDGVWAQSVEQSVAILRLQLYVQAFAGYLGHAGRN